ncbi:DUF456 domain-containing protein [Natrinema halophilum]|uniref:DUF456 domain-containing protein n=1 Tax=Natrinema halophilum TaxID=1699371 RepID=A0A7D5K800_9EURY|nr:DUF456 domain-containing protein [Natrinema halophilum]QLG50383.1 DUF456 domain-containing protein [Natrinema halophilum]
MSDRSNEATTNRDASATDDLLEETDRLLSETGADSGGRASGSAGPSSVASDDESSRAVGGSGHGRPSEPEPTAESETGASRSRLSRLTSPLASRLSLGRYFSPKVFLALVLTLGIGLVAGATVLPFGGRVIGMFVGAFAAGLIGSNRQYLEISAAGVSVGGVAAVLSHTMLAVAGSGQTLVAVGATAGLFAAVGGYYFGRDLRDGLSRDI